MVPGNMFNKPALLIKQLVFSESDLNIDVSP